MSFGSKGAQRDRFGNMEFLYNKRSDQTAAVSVPILEIGTLLLSHTPTNTPYFPL